MQVSDLPLGSERIAAGTSRIHQLRWLGEELLAVTSEGAVWFDGAGRTSRSLSFEPAKVARNPVALGDLAGSSRPAFAAHAFEADELVIYRADGTASAAVPLDYDYARRLLIADVSGDGDGEIVVAPSGARYVEIYDAEGTLLHSPRSPFWVAAVDAFDVLGDSNAEIIVYVYPDDRGGGTFFFLDGSGRTVRELPYGVTSGFDVVTRDGRPVLVTRLDGSYRIVNPDDGQEVQRLEAPLLDYFADVHAAPWKGGWVIVGSGSGYRAYHVISVFDASGDLVFQKIGEGWSKALAVADENADDFFVAKGSELWRYSYTDE